MVTITYSRDNDIGTPSLFSPSQLAEEVLAAGGGLASKFQFLGTEPGAGSDRDINIEFSSSLTGGEQSSLDGVVAAHPNSTVPAPEGVGDEGGSSNSQSSTNSASYVQKFSYMTSVLPAGTYRVGFYLELGNTKKDRASECRVQVDDSITLAEASFTSREDNAFNPVGGFLFVDLDEGSHMIDVDYRRIEFTATIRNVNIEVRPA